MLYRFLSALQVFYDKSIISPCIRLKFQTKLFLERGKSGVSGSLFFDKTLKHNPIRILDRIAPANLISLRDESCQSETGRRATMAAMVQVIG